MGFFVGLLIAIAVTTAHGTTACKGPYRGGRKPTAEALTRVLAAHAAWQHNAAATHATRANLCGADLRGASLTQ